MRVEHVSTSLLVSWFDHNSVPPETPQLLREEILKLTDHKFRELESDFGTFHARKRRIRIKFEGTVRLDALARNVHGMVCIDAAEILKCSLHLHPA